MKVVFLISLLAMTITATAKNHYSDPFYLRISDVDFNRAMPPVPGRMSPLDKKDFEIILNHQITRTTYECKRAQAVVDVKLATLFGQPYGPLTKAEVEKLADFFETIRVDTDYFVQEAKKANKRLRPYFNDQNVKPCITKEETYAYPSGHAAISKIFALALSEIYPDRKDAFMKRADEIGSDRVLAGVHHPSDIEAGKLLGTKVFETLNGNENFKTQFKRL